MSDINENTINLTLEDALKEADRILTLCICNEMKTAQKECYARSKEHFYFQVISCLFKGLDGVIAFEDEELNKALDEVSETLIVLDSLRKKRSFKSRYLSWSTPNYNDEYTDEQIHADGAHCILSGLASLLTLLSEKSITGLVRAGLHCKSAYLTLRDVKAISTTRTQYQSKVSEDAIKKGVEFGLGVFNLFFSMLPPRVLRVLKWIGFPSDRMKAFKQLKNVAKSTSIWSPIASSVLLGFNVFVEFYGGFGHPDITLVNSLLKQFSTRYQGSALVWLFEGALHQIQGKPDEAIIAYTKSAQGYSQWIEWKNACNWLMIWCYCVKFDWKKALELTDELNDSTSWSPCVLTYQSAAITKMILDETIDPSERALIKSKLTDKLIRAPKLKRPIVGRTIYIEKFVTKRCEIYWQEMKQMPKVIPTTYDRQDSGICLDDSDDDEFSDARDSFDSIDSTNINSSLHHTHDDEEMYERVNKKYQSSDPLILPILDLFLIWNIFLTFQDNHANAHRLLKRIESKLMNLTYEDTREKYLYLILMRGIIYKSIGEHNLSVDCFKFVLDNEQSLQYYKHLAPHAALEFGLLCQEMGDFDLAVKFINRSMDDYSHYLNETQIHIRAHTALNIIKQQRGGNNFDSVTDSEQLIVD